MELTAYLTLYCANSVLMRPDPSEDGHLIGGKGLKCIVNGVREAPLTAALMTRKVCKCISNLPAGPSLPIQKCGRRRRSLRPGVSSEADALVPSGRYGRDEEKKWQKKIKM